MKIALSTDHTGLEQLKKLREFLTGLGHECLDFGPKSLDETDDYPDFIRPAAEAVARGQAEVGIIMGGSGQGEAITANRVPGIRCALYYGPATALEELETEGTPTTDQYDIVRLTRKHNHANMLSFAVRFVDPTEMQKVVKIWLETPYGTAERHFRRIQKIDRTE